jgi:polyisoprenoid-binding protein YceI
MRSFLAFAAAMLLATPALADRYEFDKEHTNIMFYVNHLGFSDMLGLLTSYDGGFTFDPAHPEQSTIDVTLNPSGIRTSSSKLDSELQGEKWFNTAKFPSIHFVSSSIKVTGDHAGDVTGNLTLLGVTKPVTLHVHFNKADYFPMTQAFKAGFSADTTFKRSDFGMTSYVPMVGDEVRIEVQTEGVNLDRKKAEAIKH